MVAADAIPDSPNFQSANFHRPPGLPPLPDPSLIWSVLRRRMRYVLLPIVAVLGLAIAFVATTTPRFAATSSLVIEPRKTDMIAVNDPVQSALPASNDAIDTEVQLIGSATIAGRVAAALHLERYPEFARDVAIAFDPAHPSTHPLAQRLLRHVVVHRDGLTYVVRITATSIDRDLAARIANEFARQYVAGQLDAKNAVTSDAGKALAGRLDAMRRQVVAADAALQAYKIAHGLMSAEGSTMAEQEVSSLNDEIAKAQAEHAEKLGRLSAARAQIRRGGGGEDVGAALESGTVTNLRRQEAEASQKLADYSSRYGDLHPDVVKTRQELTAIRDQIRQQVDRIISSLEADAQSSGSRLASLTGSRARASGSLAANASAQVGYLELERRAEAARSIYAAFLNRSREVVSREGLGTADARISEFARVPARAYWPDIPLILVAAAIGGLAAGLAGAAGAEYLDGRLSTRHDVERKLRVRYLGAVPELASTLGGVRNGETPWDYLVGHPQSMFAEAFRNLRTVMMSDAPAGGRVIAVTSALPREGKSTVSICLARSFAAGGRRTVIVDCDGRRRQTSEALLGEGQAGLLRYLTGIATIDEALVRGRDDEVAVLGSNAAPPEGNDLFHRHNIARLLADLRARFDVVILDTAPVLALAETRDVAAAADLVLMVARWRKTSRKAVEAAVDLLLAADARLRGCALTLVDVGKVGSTGSDDIYSYRRAFAGYYSN